MRFRVVKYLDGFHAEVKKWFVWCPLYTDVMSGKPVFYSNAEMAIEEVEKVRKWLNGDRLVREWDDTP